ncbi:MAG: thioredoxin, partial [Eubacteriales bacterium]
QYIPTQLFIKADGTPYNPANAAEMQMDLKYDPDTNELMYTTHTGTLTKEDLLSILTEMGMK